MPVRTAPPPIVCQTCHAAAPTQNRDELEAADWMVQPKRGVGEARWPWWCATCRPRGSTSSMLTTSQFFGEKKSSG